MRHALSIAAGLLLSACGGGAGTDGAAGARPNVLVLVADDLASSATGAWARGPSHVATPNLDRLAGRGVVFERALCSSPFCTPSRLSFLTGRWPHSIRATQLFSRLHPDHPTLGTVFRDAGYATAAIGKMHWYRAKWDAGTDYGFDHIVDKPEWFAQLDPDERAAFDDYNAGWSREEREGWSMSNPDREPCPLDEDRQLASFLVDEGLRWIDAQEDPFLCVLSLYEPHAPFAFPPRLRDAVDPAALALPAFDPAELAREAPGLAAAAAARDAQKGPLTPELLRAMTAAYLASVLWLDEQLGRVDAYLAETGRYDDTVVVFWSDNGYFLGEHGQFSKNYPFRETIEIPLAILSPGIAPRRTPAIVQSLDVFPTLCELAGLPVPEFVEGESLAPVLAGADVARTVGLSEFTGLAATAQTDRWKLFVGTGPRQGWDLLFDLENDPHERDDLFAERPDVVAELVAALHAELAATPPDGVDGSSWMPGTEPLEAVRHALRQVEDGRRPPAPRRPDERR